MHFQNFVDNMLPSLATALLWALLAFVVGRIVKRHATIDVFWGLGFLVVYLESLWRADHLHAAWWSINPAHTLRWIVALVVAVWSFRLSGYLAWRQRGSAEDSRYVWIMRGARNRNKTFYALYKIYGLQGLLLWWVSLPLQAMATASHFAWPFWAGVGVVVIGVWFEGVGDWQLARFLADAANQGTTMNSGLWRYTRHPNYFGDAVVWLGFYLMACSIGLGALTILSPAVMWWLLTSLSGKPMLEAKLTKTRAGYNDYVANTSGFIPRRPRSS